MTGWPRGRSAWSVLREVPVMTLVGVLRLYQFAISPMYGPTCRFYPSCSHYAIDALREHGVARGCALIGWRLVRCNPWNPGGVDEVSPSTRRRRVHDRDNDPDHDHAGTPAPVA